MLDNWADTNISTLSGFEQHKAEMIAAQTKEPIIAQIQIGRASCRERV